jgi:hypothetical protein
MHDVNSHYEQENWQYTGNASYANQSSQALYTPANSASVSDPVAQVLQVERRRGREDKMAAPTVIEVKQADLTGGKLREDQLRTTGIAFGPSYQVKLNALFQVLVIYNAHSLPFKLFIFFTITSHKINFTARV